MPRPAAISAAVSVVRDSVLAAMRSKWTGRRALATTVACSRPRAVSGLSVWPAKTAAALASLSP
jgi:hypothetical protein